MALASPSILGTAQAKGGIGRRRQHERTAEARRRLLDATVECLARHGWTGTTTQRVAEIAGLSRGAMQHHFPSKLDLVAAATDHLMEGAMARTLETVQRLRPGEEASRLLIHRLWRRLIDSPRYHAVLEIYAAVRSEPELRRRVEGALCQLMTGISAAMSVRFRPRANGLDTDTLTLMTFSLLRGLALEQPVHGDSDRTERILNAWAGMMDVHLTLIETRPVTQGEDLPA